MLTYCRLLLAAVNAFLGLKALDLPFALPVFCKGDRIGKIYSLPAADSEASGGIAMQVVKPYITALRKESSQVLFPHLSKGLPVTRPALSIKKCKGDFNVAGSQFCSHFSPYLFELSFNFFFLCLARAILAVFMRTVFFMALAGKNSRCDKETKQHHQ